MRRRLRRLLRLGLGLAVLASCAAGGMTFRLALVNREPVEEAEAPSTGRVPELEPVHLEPDPFKDAHHIDTLIRATDFEAALHHCHSVARNVFGSDERLLDYREALCLEALGRWSEAREAYRKTTQPNPDLPAALWSRGVLGQARCALAEGKIALSRDLLSQVLVRSGDPACRGKRIVEECVYLLGRAELQDLGAPGPLDPFDTSTIGWPRLEGSIDRYLDWLPVEHPDHSHGSKPTTGHGHEQPEANHDTHNPVPHKEETHQTDEAHKPHRGVHKDETHQSDTAHNEKTPTASTVQSAHWLLKLAQRLSVNLKEPEKGLVEQLKAVSKATGWPIEIEPKAAEKSAAISLALDLDHAPTAAVLTALTRRYGLIWSIASGGISIKCDDHADLAARRALTLELFRAGISIAPNHPRVRVVRIVAANLEFLGGGMRRAAEDYRRLLDDETNAPEAVYAAYNLGIVELANGNTSLAQFRFLNAIDRAPGTKWADFGWWWIGRGYLDNGATAAARKPLQLAREGRTKSIIAASELALAACALLEGNEDEVRDILSEHRVHTHDSHAALAELFSSFLRFKSNPSELRVQRVADAVMATGEGRLLGPAGYLLAGQIYREIGRFDRAAGLYDAARDLARGPLGVQMTYEAAERYDELDLREEARKRYRIVQAIDSETWGMKAELRLADLAARDRRGLECVQRCRDLIGRKGIDTSEVLAIMGRGYELLKQYRLAAECYAGRVPAQ